MTKLYRLTAVNPNEIVLADPDNLRNTLTFRNKAVSKVVGGKRLTNVRSEMIDNSQVPLVVSGDQTIDDTVSVRVIISGSDLSASTIMDTIWPRVKQNVDAALNDGAGKGFIPTKASFVVKAVTTP